MQFLNALAAWQWAVLAAIPIGIVLLYFLKLKRDPELVSSTLLWRRVLEDLHVNRPFQWLRFNILLLLQLLLIALLALAGLRPAISRVATGVKHYVILIDNSASMAARDVEPSRLEAAKAAAIREVIDRLMDSDDRAMVIAFHDRAEVVASYTSDKRELRRKIRAITQSHRSTDLSEALRIAVALANPETVQTDDLVTDEAGRPIGAVEPVRATAVLYSDGGFPDVPEAVLGDLELSYRAIGSDVTNVAITRLSVREVEGQPETAEVFAEVSRFGTGTPNARVRLFWNDTLVASQQIAFGQSEVQPLAFRLKAQPGIVRLELGPDDPLPLDNQATAVLSEPRKAQVLLVTTGNRWLERALGTEEVARIADVRKVAPAELSNPTLQTAVATGQFDLVISDRAPLATLPEANTLLFGVFPADLKERPVHEAEWPKIIDTDTSHPLLRYVNLAPLRIARARLIEPPSGATVLANSAHGPLIWLRSRGVYLDCVVAFPLADEQGQPVTDWPIRISFPIFLMNALRILGQAQVAIAREPIRPGTPIELPVSRVRGATRIVAMLPDGTPRPMTRLGDRWVLAATDHVGLYRVRADGNDVLTVPVALQDPRESDLSVRSLARIGAREITATERQLLVRYDLWPWLVAAALVVCLTEWYIYNRRIAL